MSWTNDGAIPIGHEDIVAVLEAIRARSVADALLTLFELLKQAEVAWNWQVFGGKGRCALDVKTSKSRETKDQKSYTPLAIVLVAIGVWVWVARLFRDSIAVSVPARVPTLCSLGHKIVSTFTFISVEAGRGIT